jgi:hypothetical protein
MNRNRFLAAVLGSSMLLLGGMAVAQNKEPAKNVSGKLHPNLKRAQNQAANAYTSIQAAQQANEFDLGGHAQKAKALLEQVNSELKLAAETANKNGK